MNRVNLHFFFCKNGNYLCNYGAQKNNKAINIEKENIRFSLIWDTLMKMLAWLLVCICMQMLIYLFIFCFVFCCYFSKRGGGGLCGKELHFINLCESNYTLKCKILSHITTAILSLNIITLFKLLPCPNIFSL